MPVKYTVNKKNIETKNHLNLLNLNVLNLNIGNSEPGLDFPVVNSSLRHWFSPHLCVPYTKR